MPTEALKGSNMHIGFRPSGGRGEYEVVGSQAGQSAASLEGWEFHFRWPDNVVRDTLLWLDPGESGKPRLRSLVKPEFQVGRLVAAVLLLPPPIRDMRKVASTLPVLQARKYVVTKVGFGRDTEFASPPESVTAEPNYVEITNSSANDYVNVSARWAQITEVCNHRARFPQGVSASLDLYCRYMQSGNPVDAELLQIGNDLRRAMGISDSTYDPDHDPLPALEQMAGIPTSDEPPLPAPDQLNEDEIEVKARSAQIYRLAKARDFSARRFSIEVREAYRQRCAFCGARLGGIPGVPSGIDAAHILAWSSYNLDIVGNGISLCKNHHWAFDAALMVPVLQNGVYIVRFTRLAAERLERSALEVLGSDGFAIPEDWLPTDVNQRPNSRYLIRLYEDVAIDF